jgi:hypothetical protein
VNLSATARDVDSSTTSSHLSDLDAYEFSQAAVSKQAIGENAPVQCLKPASAGCT